MKRYAKDYDPETLVVPKCLYSSANERAIELEGALTELASYLSVGGYNSDKVDPAVYVERIKEGIDSAIRVEVKRIVPKLGM